MKSKFLLLLMLFATAAAHASNIVLPDACGSDKVNFDVTTKKDQPLPHGPADGKAQIVFFYTYSTVSARGGGVARFGVDGAWVGADSKNSYFTFDVAPGEHSICAAVPHRFALSDDLRKDAVGVSTFTAEAGQTYYFEYKYFLGLGTVIATFKQLDDPKGKYYVKAFELSVSTPQK